MLYEKNTISDTNNIKQTLECLNTFSSKEDLTLFVVNIDNQLVGTITDGDIRRGLLNGKTLETPIIDVMFRGFRFLEKENIDIEKVQFFRQNEISLVPILDKEKRIVKIINLDEKRSFLPIDAVLMAGGRGERLKPLTNDTPKPLLKIGKKPIIEYNLDSLESYGVENIWISVRYLAEKITDYLGNGADKNLKINYIHENNPLGTAGALALIEDFEHDTILLMNSDLLTNIDFEDFYKTFLQTKAALCVATVPYHVSIPYAILETSENEIVEIKEKPTYTFQANAGMYLFQRKFLDIIPKNQFFDAPDLIQALIDQKEKVSYYPILSYWLDIGKHEDFAKAQEDVKHIKF
jgi:dTDP-glucose pyrophosphorylase